MNQDDIRTSNEIEKLKYSLHGLPDFGIDLLTVTEAARIIATEHAADLRQQSVFSSANSALQTSEGFEALINEMLPNFLKKLILGVETGRLKPGKIGRNIDEQIDPERTYLAYDALEKWLDERDVAPGETFFDWGESQDVARRALHSVAAHMRRNHGVDSLAIAEDLELLAAAWKRGYLARS